MACTRVSSRTLPGFLSVFPACFPTTPSSFLGKPRGNSVEFVILVGSEPCLRLFWGQNRQNTGYFAGIPGKPRYTWKIPGYRADFLNFAPDFAPDQLSDSGKLASFPRETREKQNGAPNTLWFPWKLPETQSAGDPLVSLWVAGNPCTGHLYRPTRFISFYGKENLNKRTLSHSTQARHRCELARASTITGTPPEPPKRLR